ncbi:MAG: extracellular solute-binding protein [Anaerolineales bacterium]
MRAKVSLCLLLLILAGCVPAPEPTPETRVVILWHTFAGPEAQALQELGDAFNSAHPRGPTLIVEYQSDIYAKVATTPLAHRPDLAVISAGELDTYYEANLIASPRLPSEITEDLLPMGTDLYSGDRRLRALPLGLVSYLLYYNTDWLRDLGYDPQSATLLDLQNTACSATDPQTGQVGLGIPTRPGIFLALLSVGERVAAGEDYRFQSETVPVVADTLQVLLNNNCAYLFESPEAAVETFANSAVAFVALSTREQDAIESAVARRTNFSVSVAPLPGLAESGHSLWHGPGLVLFVPEGARREAAESVLTWFLEPDVQRAWREQTHYLPLRRTVIEELLESGGGLERSERDILRLALEAADSGRWYTFSGVVESAACRAALVRGLNQLEGSSDAVETLAMMETICNEEGP